MRRAQVLAVIAGVGLAAMTVVQAQQPAATGPNVAQIEKVKDNLFMITGGGGNTAAYITANGVVLVDTKLSNWGQAILDKVRTVSDKPVTHIINTHPWRPRRQQRVLRRQCRDCRASQHQRQHGEDEKLRDARDQTRHAR